MQSGFGSVFQPGLATGPSLAVELVSSHARIGGSVNLGAYTRLSDLLNFHDEILTVKDGKVLNRTGIATADGAAELDVRLDTPDDRDRPLGLRAASRRRGGREARPPDAGRHPGPRDHRHVLRLSRARSRSRICAPRSRAGSR